jgi:hypothetical protein
MRRAASGGDAALSQRDRRRALHVVPNGYLQNRLTTQNTAADGIVQLDDDRIHQRGNCFGNTSPWPPHQIRGTPPRLRGFIVPSPIHTIIGEQVSVPEKAWQKTAGFPPQPNLVRLAASTVITLCSCAEHLQLSFHLRGRQLIDGRYVHVCIRIRKRFKTLSGFARISQGFQASCLLSSHMRMSPSKSSGSGDPASVVNSPVMSTTARSTPLMYQLSAKLCAPDMRPSCQQSGLMVGLAQRGPMP